MFLEILTDPIESDELPLPYKTDRVITVSLEIF